MSKNDYKFVVLNLLDNVAVALDEIPKNATVVINESEDIKLQNTIKFGHKFSIRTIIQDESIIKYGETIGRASAFIIPGEHVHLHNVEGNRGRGDQK